ncbi:MAG: MerR family transcriptional regulator [Erysipelotrichaceae bacterium]|nr:MerR family transcriptional regulator [Erysipelotrichaceae bacterium]
MEHYKTLRQVCDELGISRRTIQGYEEKQLVQPIARNKYGHLLYDEKTVKRIAFIRFSQQIGFSVNEIREFADGYPREIKNILSRQAALLQQRKDVIEKQMSQIRKLISMDMDADYLSEIYAIVKENRQ